MILSPPSPLPPLPSPLPPADRALLHLLRPVVPALHRDEWTRSWEAELWCFHHARRTKGTRTLDFGLIHDALWLRSEQIHQAVSGTATLCLLTLLLLVTVSALPAFARTGCWQGLGLWLVHQAPRFVLESTLILFVSYATAASELEQATPRRRFWLKARLFHLAKNLFVLLLAFNLTADLTFPFQQAVPLTAEFLQTMSFALLALLGLRWSAHDNLARCRTCLRSLAAPARVGRPSHNFLEWNGTELLCLRGHGRLSIPELQTSWCQASAWVTLPGS